MISRDRLLSSASQVVGLVCMTWLLLSYAGCLHAAEPIKIGAVFCVTGWAGNAGTGNLEALQVQVEKTNQEGGVLGRPIELYVEDDQSNPTNAAIAATKLIRDKGVCVVMGSTITNMCMPMLPLFEKEHVPNLSGGAGHDITEPLKKWVFRAAPLSDEHLSPIMLKFAVEGLKARNIALLHSTDASGMMGAKGVKQNAPGFNVKVIIEEQFEPTDTNVMAQLTRIKAARPDAILIYTSTAPAAVVEKNYRQLGMENIPVVGSHGFPTPEFIKLVGGSAPNWTVMAIKSVYADKLPPDDPYRKNFYDPFITLLRKKYGPNKPYNSFQGNGVTSYQILLAALNKAKTDDRTALRDAIESISIDTINGRFTYSSTNHDGADPNAYGPVIIKDGAYWPWEYRDSKEIPSNPNAMAFP